MALPEKKIVLVIGSSIAGSVFALQLLTHPILRSIYRPILFDGAATIPGLGNSDIAPFDHPAGQSGAAVALSKQAMYPLRRLELGPGLDDICQNTERLSMYRQPWSGSRDGSHEGIQIINWEAGPDVGVMGGLWTVQRGALQGLLVKTILDRGGEVIPRRKLIKIVEHESRGDSGAVEAIFADGHSQRGDLLIGADGAWSTSRQHLYTKTTASGEQIVDEAWKPDFKDLHIVHGISHAETTDDKPSIYGMGFHGVSTGTWTLKGNRQMWTIYEAPCPPPENSKSWTQGENASEALSKKWNKDVFTGGYDQASTEAFIERFRQVWHPSAGTFGKLFDATEKIVRVGLWQKLFTRLGNVQWSPKEKRPKECGSDLGGDSSNGNIVLIGDAARVLMPSAGQGAGFAVEDATVLADCLLNHPPSIKDANCDFSNAIKKHTRQRLPRYHKISVVADWGAHIAVGRNWMYKFLRDYAAGWTPKPADQSERKKRSWLDKKIGDKWLFEPQFEVKLKSDRKDPNQ